jgi:hypothetical protein
MPVYIRNRLTALDCLSGHNLTRPGRGLRQQSLIWRDPLAGRRDVANVASQVTVSLSYRFVANSP